MKKEKKGEGKGRAIILMMVMMMVMGCNSGGVKDPEKVFLSDIANLGKGFLDVFVSFGDMITETLGIKADTKKSEIGGYFSKIAETMKGVKEKLGKILEENGKYEKVKGKVEEFIGKISKIEEGAKEASKGATGDFAIGNAVKEGQDAVAADVTSVNSLVKGIKTIVDVVLTKGKADADAIQDGEKKKVGQFFARKDDAPQEAETAKANASVGAVSGADILQAIVKSDQVVNGDIKIDAAQDAAEIAAAKKDDAKKEIKEDQKDAIIAAGIALRAMAKDGKFAAKQDASDKYANAVNGVVSSAVNKVLSTLIIAIRNRVDEGLKEINKVLGEIKQGEGSESKVKAN
ncbi:Variable outer membrane protein (plasmid) [Borrelia crocidurae DOU]|uniref:Variable large protein n=1 Tax=Borrelia crocidurae DOU TaxID=1293575 RepID=W5SRU9_9SPIR|nr:variable large family protein [Borrelia crocidurae]AHH07786.1 Variable outer membrane protein [Borrelia crocidurae DOU]